MARPPVPLSTLQLLPSRVTAQDSRPRQSRFSFPVGLLHPLQCAGLARRPRLPAPQPDPLGDRGPGHPPGASELQPRHHRKLQPPRRSLTPPGPHHPGRSTLAGLTAMSRHLPPIQTHPPCMRLIFWKRTLNAENGVFRYQSGKRVDYFPIAGYTPGTPKLGFGR